MLARSSPATCGAVKLWALLLLPRGEEFGEGDQLDDLPLALELIQGDDFVQGPGRQFGNFVELFFGGKEQPRPGVEQDVQHIGFGKIRQDRHHHYPETHRPQINHAPLRRILGQNRHPVTLAEPQVLQPRRHFQGTGLEFPIGQRFLESQTDGRPAGEFIATGIEQVVQGPGGIGALRHGDLQKGC